MEQRLYLAASRREKANEEEENTRLKEGGGEKKVSVTSESTYRNDSGRESKIPAGSSVRPFSLRPLKATRNEIDHVFRAGSLSCLIAHHHHHHHHH